VLSKSVPGKTGDDLPLADSNCGMGSKVQPRTLVCRRDGGLAIAPMFCPETLVFFLSPSGLSLPGIGVLSHG